VSRAVFVDTSAWYALADGGDSHHVEAERLARPLLGERIRLVTTNHIVAETYTLLRVRLGFAAALDFLGRVQSSLTVERVHVPEGWEQAAEEMLTGYADQDFSYVEAISFISMRRLGLTWAFAFDRHFAIAGFRLVRDER